ncbi:165_t:CDS:2, partial [Dentiscutata heterogama]
MKQSKRARFLKSARNKKAQKAKDNKLLADEFSNDESSSIESSNIESLDIESSDIESSDNEFTDIEFSSNESSSDENDWVDELFEPELPANAYTLMLDAAHKPNAFKKTSRNGFYIGNAKSTMRNKRRNLRLAAQGSQKITNYFSVNNNNKSNEVFNESDEVSNENSSKEENAEFSLLDLEQKIRNGVQDIQFQYTMQYLRLVESGVSKIQASNTISTSLNRGPWTARLIRSWDVVEYHHSFLERMAQERLHILVTHDKSAFYANDDQKVFWAPIDEQLLCPKSSGSSLMVSEFLCDTIGRLQLDDIYKQQNNSLL